VVNGDDEGYQQIINEIKGVVDKNDSWKLNSRNV
jgi:hypothetical protein